MAITAISSVKLGSRNNTTFRGKMQEDDEIPAGNAPRKAGNLAKVPVIVMLAMSPINASSGQPQIAELNKEALTELVEAKAPEIQSTQQQTFPNHLYKWNFIKRRLLFAQDFNTLGREKKTSTALYTGFRRRIKHCK